MDSEPKAAPLARPPDVAQRFVRLLDTVDRLRSPGGCPWDRAQTPRSLLPYFLEEVYEVIESIEAERPQALQEELGDVLLHVVFQARLAQEQGQFTIADCLQRVADKLVRRHPHVFGDAAAAGPAEARQRWETAKQREKGRTSLLDGVPRQLPALTRAQRVQEKAAAVGFDWERLEEVWAKVGEELAELRAACDAGDAAAVAEEFGDLLFSLVNLARFLRLDAEGALRQAIAKFERRFRAIEAELARQGRRVDEASLAELDALWERLRQQG
ncbi:MAG: nucleoside triphosphate pyrophosphohydrolase [Candidatus Tectimicrobiota bacterium]|nr:MAG: nucleoside triphosphate pyrophosphohydrolase [Candidatus Tectomicrobia bacterium]